MLPDLDDYIWGSWVSVTADHSGWRTVLRVTGLGFALLWLHYVCYRLVGSTVWDLIECLPGYKPTFQTKKSYNSGSSSSCTFYGSGSTKS